MAERTGREAAIQAVLFDLDGTLRHSIPSSIDVFHQVAEELGVQFGPKEIREAQRWQYEYWAGSEELVLDRAATVDGSEGDFWRAYARRHLQVLGVAEAETVALAAEITQRLLHEHEPIDTVAGDAHETLYHLRQAGYILGVVSNRSQPFVPLMEELRLMQHFDFALAAGEIGRWKPDPMLFEHVLERMQVSPDAAIYVGDNFYADVLGAEAAGLRPILLDPHGLFPEAGCEVIQTLADLLPILSGMDGN